MFRASLRADASDCGQDRPAGRCARRPGRHAHLSREHASFASARSMTHGVFPPLTAMMKRPRAATAARASAAIVPAAALATASSSSNTSSFIQLLQYAALLPLRLLCMTAPQSTSSLGRGCDRLHFGRCRILPPTRRRNLADLTGAPRIRIVFVNRSSRLQHRIDDPPRLFHIILTSELRGVSSHGVAQQPFVSLHLTRLRSTTCQHLRHGSDPVGW